MVVVNETKGGQLLALLEQCAHLNADAPVSYTHLDVYKRQVWLSKSGISPWCWWIRQACPKKNGLPTAGKELAAAMLDVYKRQVYYSSEVHAAKSGTVIVSQYSSSYGNYVVVSHGSGNTTLYAHMSSRSVSVGQWVDQGDVLGITGSTGISSGPHLHFAITENGVRVDPLQYLTGYVQAW